MKKITFLGTGHGMPKRSCSTCILIEENGTKLLIDTGAGQESVQQLYKAGHEPSDITNIFLTHHHSDHITGIFSLFRQFSKKLIQRKIYCSLSVKEAIDSLFKIVSSNYFEKISSYTEFILIEDGDVFNINNWCLTFFDIHSKKCPQMGVSIKFDDTTKLSYLGDEPYNNLNEKYVRYSDFLIHEAFCLEKDKDKYNPHKISHCTAKEAAENAEKLKSKKLALFHIEDDTLETRRISYFEEAQKYFSGEIFIAHDLDEILF